MSIDGARSPGAKNFARRGSNMVVAEKAQVKGRRASFLPQDLDASKKVRGFTPNAVFDRNRSKSPAFGRKVN